MKYKDLLLALAAYSALLLSSAAQPLPQGPFPPDQWPASADKNKTVHFVTIGDALLPLSDKWVTGNMSILNDTDQATAPIRIGGLDGVKATGNYLNVADLEYSEWADDDEIDILMQVYGDAALLQPNGTPRNFSFLIGTLPEIEAPAGGQIPAEAKNQQWNWVLFRIPNTIRPSDGAHRVGSIPANAQGATQAGGVNGGTIRLQSVPNLIVRAVAFGEKGAFGEPEQVNLFAGSEQCAPEPAANLAWIDLANSQSEHLLVLNDKDQTVSIETNVGPATDKRRAVRPLGQYMNFAVTNNFLGLGCNEAHTVKICVEFFDDPALAGKRFGPEAFATDNKGSLGSVPEDQRHTLAGSGTWERRSWTIPAVNLTGVNVAPLTAGPRMIFEENAPVFISKFSLGIFRTGTNALAGLDPLPDCFADTDFCKGLYGNFAEMDLPNAKLDGLAPGTSNGDQEMIQAEAGPVSDRRLAIRPARDDGSAQFTHQYLNFAITDEKLGPTSQPSVRLAICATYYDDPALAGATFRPEVYMSDRGGTLGFAFAPADLAVRLEGTDKWRDAYFELTDVKFTGVNQGPQAAARFFASDKIFLSRVRYGVIRPCGPDANVNPLADCKPVVVTLTGIRNSDGTIRLSWPIALGSFALQENNDVATSAGWQTVTTTPTVSGTDNVITITPAGKKFFRLVSTP
ncbi:MAG TPA: hypothetical protein VK633_05210 [Verrucomicrobiae bacterium]|nr:hypothetical protein [Verrucomicrobiae bacterium]